MEQSLNSFGRFGVAFSEQVPTVHRLEDLYEAAVPGREPIRVGLLVDGNTLPAAFAEIVRDLSQRPFIDVVLVVRNAAPVKGPARTLARKWAHRLRPEFWRAVPWTLFSRIDARFADPAIHPLAPTNIEAFIEHVPTIDVIAEREGFTDRFSDLDVDRTKAENLDVLIRFGFNILRGDILNAARYGVWSFHHGDNRFYRGGPFLFWEILHNETLSGVILQRLTEELDAGLVLGRAHFNTSPGLSWHRNMPQPFWGANHLLLQKLWTLHAHGWDKVLEQSVSEELFLGRRRLYRSPKGLDVPRWLGAQVGKRVFRRLKSLVAGERLHQWMIGLRPQKASKDDLFATAPFIVLAAPRDHFWADPFLFEDHGRMHLFFENYDYRTRKGVIAHAEVIDGSIGQVRVVLEEPTHLSYPHVFRCDGSIYMIPESLGAREVTLYRAADFPFTWEKAATLWRGPFVDSTPFQYNGKWWCFTTHVESRGRASSLLLFHADKVTGPWHCHPRGPLLVHPDGSRCAGPVVRHAGQLYRVGQNCAGRYGSSFSFYRIDEISIDHYQETLVRTIEPSMVDPFAVCTHSYSQAGNLEVVDFQRIERVRDVTDFP